ncbi:MAG: hypothetical protein V7661_05935 [Sulfitobacter sp.]
MKRITVALTVGAATLAAAPTAFAQDVASQSVELSAAQMRLAAEASLHKNHPDRALVFADALLKRDPNDVTALLIRSHALRSLRQYAPAQKAARAAWRNADTENQKFSAAMLMAQSLSSDGKRTRAQLWLRRAAQVAPSKGHAVRAAQDFRYVQQRNPWQTHLSFTLAPNSNINNGSARDSSTLLYEVFSPLFGENVEVDLGAASQALSGVEMGFNVQSRYRFKQTERQAHDLRLGMSYRTYILSQSSQDDLDAEDTERTTRGEPARNVEGSDFSYGTLKLGYGYKQLRADRRGEFSFNADLGQTFYGGKRYNSFLQASIGQTYQTSATTRLSFGLSGDIRNAQRGDDYETVRLSGGISRKLSNGDGLYLGATAAASYSDVERLEYNEVGLRSSYVLGRDIKGTSLQFAVSTSFRDYDVSPHDPSGRREFTVGGEVTATFKQIDYYGFNPSISLTASKTNSNIGLYDVNRVGLSIGIASAF